MKTLLTAALTVLALTTAGSAFGFCPVGGSENSVGLPGPGGRDARAAVRAFNLSNVVIGQDRFLRDHGYCSTGTTTEASEFGGINVTRTYENRMDGSINEIGGRYNASFGRASLFVDDLAVDGLGSREDLDDASAALVFKALKDAGIRDPNLVMGGVTLQAASITCSTPVVPNPRAHCSIADGIRNIPVADAAAQDLNQVLEDLGAFLNDGRIGASNKGVSLVKCGQAVVPQPVPHCSVVISAE